MNPFIWVKDGVLTSEFCKQAISKFETDPRKQRGEIASGYFPEVKSSIDLPVSLLDGWQQQDGVFFNALKEHIQEYAEHVDKIVPDVRLLFGQKMKDSGYMMQKTQPGQGYVWHCDRLLQDGYAREFTYIWYLNDVAEGGETEFYDGTLIKPVQGRVLIFPATWNFIHRGNAPATDRYIVVGWMMSK